MIGLLAFAIFGTQRDVINSLRPSAPSWLRSASNPSSNDPPETQAGDRSQSPSFRLFLLRLCKPDPSFVSTIPSRPQSSAVPPPSMAGWRRRPAPERQTSDGLGIDAVPDFIEPGSGGGPRAASGGGPGLPPRLASDSSQQTEESPALSDMSFGEMVRGGSRSRWPGSQRTEMKRMESDLSSKTGDILLDGASSDIKFEEMVGLPVLRKTQEIQAPAKASGGEG